MKLNGTAPASSADERTKLKRSLGLWMAVVSDNGQGFDPESELTGLWFCWYDRTCRPRGGNAHDRERPQRRDDLTRGASQPSCRG